MRRESTRTERRGRRRIAVALLFALVTAATACGNRADEVAVQTASGDNPATAGADAGGGNVASDGGTLPSDVGAPGVPSDGAVGQATPDGSPTANPTPSDGGSPTANPTPSDGGSPTGPKKYDQGVTDTEIKLGGVMALGGLLKLSNDRAARAYFKAVNAKGGVNGRKITLLAYDDQWDATRNAALTRQAYESDKVFAFVNNFAMVTNHGGKAFIEQNNVPVVGGDGIDVGTWGVSPNYYPIAYLESSVGPRVLGQFAIKNGCKRVANIQDNVDAGRLWSKSFEQGMKDIDPNQKFVYSGEVPLTTTDLSAQLSRAKSAQADCLTLGGLDHNLARKNADQLDFKPRFYLPSPGYDVNYAKNYANADGDYIMLQTDILENTSKNPALQQYVDDMKRYEPGALGDGSVPTWQIMSYVSAMVMTEALKRMGNELTKENLFKVLNSMTNFETGLVNPITYRPGPHPGADCGKIVQLKNKTFQIANPQACL